MTIETTRMIGDEIANQISRKLIEIKSSFNCEVQDAFITAIAEKVLPSIQNTLDTQGRANYTMVDRKFGGLQRNPEVENTHQSWQYCPQNVFYTGKS